MSIKPSCAKERSSYTGHNWAGYLAVVLLFALACGGLAYWQYSRGQEAQRVNTILEKNFHALPESLEVLSDDLEWRHVTAQGQYRYEDQLLLRNRPLGGVVGFEVITPLHLIDGRVLMIKRGWLESAPPPEKQTATAVNPSSAAEQVTVLLRRGTDQPAYVQQGQINRLNLNDAAAHLKQKMPELAVITEYYGVLSEAQPTDEYVLQPGSAVKLTALSQSPPFQNAGMHWSYAFQWILFAAAAGFALYYFRFRKPNERRRVERVRISDEEYEDSVIAKLDAKP